MKRLCCAIGALLLGASGCSNKELPPEGEVVLAVYTDAPVPEAPGKPPGKGRPPALFDRIRFDIYKPGEKTPCGADCSQDFPLTEDKLLSGGASIGLTPPPGKTGYRVRIRIYRDAFADDLEPLERTTLEAVVTLPAAPQNGIKSVSIFLATKNVGKPQGTLDTPIAAQTKSAASSHGTWQKAQRVSCADSALPGEVCVPGGAFWMGDPKVAGGAARDEAPLPRLVVLSPFFIDTSEVTVGAFRNWMLTRGDKNAAADPDFRDPHSFDKNVTSDFCEFPADPADASHDTLPLNCISYERAHEYCSERDPAHPSDLPTEAQLEYVAGALEDRPYPWGFDVPGCSDAVFALGGASANFTYHLASQCHVLDTYGGPEKAGSGARDIVKLGGVSVLDLAGDLSELARDTWSKQSGPYWSQLLLVDPLYTTDTPNPQHVARGGSWGSGAYELQSAFREEVEAKPPINGDSDTHLGPLVGFRCARPALPAPQP